MYQGVNLLVWKWSTSSSRSLLETYNKGTPSCTSISWVIFKFNSHYPMTTLNLLSQDLNMIKVNPESHVNVLYYLASMKHPFRHVAPRWWEPSNAILHVHHCRCSLWRVSPIHVQQVSQTFSYDPSHWKWKNTCINAGVSQNVSTNAIVFLSRS